MNNPKKLKNFTAMYKEDVKTLRDFKYFAQSGGVGKDFPDRNNCAVRSLANALDWTIQQATDYLAVFGRKKNKGTTCEQLIKAYKLAKLTDVRVYGSGEKSKYWSRAAETASSGGITFGKLLSQPKYKTGTHIVIVTRHAVCIKDGKPVDVDGTFINKNKVVLMTFSKE